MNNKRMEEREFKFVTKEILSFFDNFCQRHGLKYFAAYGTLLGIIRHGGFIPWDDDIDVCMLRGDYERFLTLFEAEQQGRYYVLSSTSASSDTYYNNFARLCDNRVICKIQGTFDIENFGAFIDIFPLDNVPEDKIERIDFYKECKAAFEDVLYSLPARCYRTLPWKRAVKFHLNLPKRIPNLIRGIKNTRNRRDSILIRYNDVCTKYVCYLFDIPSDSLVITREDFEHLIRAKFEDIDVSIPRQYDKILRSYYGDYMQLPPENERYSRHHFTPYWRNNV